MVNSISQQVRSFIYQMNTFSGTLRVKDRINSHEDFLDLLLLRDTNEINRCIREIFSKTVGSCESIKSINYDTLYIVFFDKQKIEAIMGSDFLSPDIQFPTFEQLSEEYIWSKKVKCKAYVTGEYKSLDTLAEARLSYTLKMINYLHRMLTQGIRPWEYIFLSSDGPKIQGKLFLSTLDTLLEIKMRIEDLKKLGAPPFIEQEHQKDLEKTQLTIDCLFGLTCG